MSFRAIPKKKVLTIKIPESLDSEVREKAYRDRKSLSYVASKAICLGMKMSLAKHGIDVPPKHSTVT